MSEKEWKDKLSEADSGQQYSLLNELVSRTREDPIVAVEVFDTLDKGTGEALLHTDHQLNQDLAWELLELAACAKPRVGVEWCPEMKAAIRDETGSVRTRAINALAAVQRGADEQICIDELEELICKLYTDAEIDIDERESIAKILGATLSPSAAEELLRSLEYEHESVADAAKSSLTQIQDRAIQDLLSGGGGNEEDAAEVICAIAEERPALIASKSGKLTICMKKVSGSSQEKVADAVKALVINEKDVLSSVIPKLVDLLDDEDIGSLSKEFILEALRRYPDLCSGLIAQESPKSYDVDRVSEPLGATEPRLKQLTAALSQEAVAPVAAAAIRHSSKVEHDRRWLAAEILLESLTNTEGKRKHIDVLSSLLSEATEDPPDELCDQLVLILAEQAASHSTARSALEHLSETSDKAARMVTEACLRSIDDPAGGTRWSSQVIASVARSRPAVVAGYMDELEAALDSSTDTVQVRIAKALKLTLESGAATATTSLQQQLIRMLDSDSAGVQETACYTLIATGLYPVPSSMKRLRRDADSEDVKSAAQEAVRALRRQHEPPDPDHLASRDVQELSVAEPDHLRYRKDVGHWCRPSLSQLDRELIRRAAERVDEGGDGQVTLPHYTPELILALTVELLGRRLGEDATIVIFSPIFRNRWGTKGDIKDEYGRYGVADSESEGIQVTPLPEIIAPESSRHDGKAETSLTIVKRVSELRQVSDPDAVLLNFTAKIKQEHKEVLDELVDDTLDAPTIALFSPLTEFKDGWYTDYRSPSPDLLAARSVHARGSPGTEEPKDNACCRGEIRDAESLPEILEALEGRDPTSGETAMEESEISYRRLQRGPKLVNVPVQDDEVLYQLQQIHQREANLAGDDAYDELSDQIFYTQLLFERLPVPPESYDRWIESQRVDGNFRVPQPTTEEIDDLESFGLMQNAPGSTTAVKGVVREFDKLRDALQSCHPVFHQIVEASEHVASTDLTIAVFAHKSTWASILEEALADDRNLDPGDLRSEGVNVVGPREARTLSDVDALIVPGPLRPSARGYYHHTGAETVLLLTYGSRWIQTIEKMSQQVSEDLSLVTTGSESGLPAPELIQLSVGQESEEPEAEETAAGDTTEGETSHREEAASDMGERMSTQNEERMIRAFREARKKERRERGEDDRKYRRYLIQTDNGELRRSSQDRVIRQRQGSSEVSRPYHWVSPGVLSEGDAILHIDAETRRDLWMAHLEQTWSDEIQNVEEAVEMHQLWFGAASEIVKRVEEGVTYSPDQRGLYRSIHSRLSAENTEFDRAEGTVRDWFQSVYEADDPLELVEDPTLRIGPSSERDIEQIAEVFNHTELKDRSDRVDWAMREFRRINRQEGKEFRQSLLDRIVEEGSEAFDQISKLTVSEVTVVNQD